MNREQLKTRIRMLGLDIYDDPPEGLSAIDDAVVRKAKSARPVVGIFIDEVGDDGVVWACEPALAITWSDRPGSLEEVYVDRAERNFEGVDTTRKEAAGMAAQWAHLLNDVIAERNARGMDAVDEVLAECVADERAECDQWVKRNPPNRDFRQVLRAIEAEQALYYVDHDRSQLEEHPEIESAFAAALKEVERTMGLVAAALGQDDWIKSFHWNQDIHGENADLWHMARNLWYAASRLSDPYGC